MFSLFKKHKPNINSISIPNFGWNLAQEDSAIKQWINKEQTMALSINFFDLPPDLPTIKSVEKLRDYYREQVAQANGGLIQVDLLELKGFMAIKTVFKIKPEESGITYLTSLTIPFKALSYVIKIQALEAGLAGMRESFIADRLIKEKVIETGGSGLIGWDKDPYLNGFTKGFPMNLSEKPEYDLDFPEHPLSISRSLIGQIEAEIEAKDILKKTKRFEK